MIVPRNSRYKTWTCKAAQDESHEPHQSSRSRKIVLLTKSQLKLQEKCQGIRSCHVQPQVAASSPPLRIHNFDTALASAPATIRLPLPSITVQHLISVQHKPSFSQQNLERGQFQTLESLSMEYHSMPANIPIKYPKNDTSWKNRG